MSSMIHIMPPNPHRFLATASNKNLCHLCLKLKHHGDHISDDAWLRLQTENARKKSALRLHSRVRLLVPVDMPKMPAGCVGSVVLIRYEDDTTYIIKLDELPDSRISVDENELDVLEVLS